MTYHIKNLDILNPETILNEIVQAVRERFGLDMITDAFRPGDTGVHGTIPDLRGIDMRCRDPHIGNHVADYVNVRWQYDHTRPKKKCAIFHNTGKGFHLHFQTHPNTIKIKPRKW